MYTVFKIPKRGGKFRTIEAPCDSLKEEQQRRLKILRKELKISPFAHAFQPYKNIATMAMPHVGKEWVGCFDITDFFPSITIANFQKMTKSSPVTLPVEFYDFNDGKGMRLPQGAPTSPFLSNAYLFSFDWRMAWLCHGYNCDYTRYADDIVVSGGSKDCIAAIFKIASSILYNQCGLRVHPKKTKYMHRTQRQLVCGVIVNEKLNLPRRWRKNLRAEIFQKGLVEDETKGRIAFKEMIINNKKESHSSLDIIKSILLSQKLSASLGGE